MHHVRQQRHLQKLLRRVQEAPDALALARLGDQELDEVLASNLLRGPDLSKASHAKIIRSLYGADAAFSRLWASIEDNLRKLPEDLLPQVAANRVSPGRFFKILVQTEIDRRAKSKKLNTLSAPSDNGTTTPDWWRDK